MRMSPNSPVVLLPYGSYRAPVKRRSVDPARSVVRFSRSRKKRGWLWMLSLLLGFSIPIGISSQRYYYPDFKVDLPILEKIFPGKPDKPSDEPVTPPVIKTDEPVTPPVIEPDKPEKPPVIPVDEPEKPIVEEPPDKPVDKPGAVNGVTMDDVDMSKVIDTFKHIYWEEDKGENGDWVEHKPNERGGKLEAYVLEQFTRVLKNRPDILKQIQDLEHGFIVKFYYPGIQDLGGDMSSGVGYYPAKMRLSVGNLEDNSGNLDDNYAVVPHELTHFIDSLNRSGIPGNSDGLLAEWSEEEVTRFKKARTEERARMEKGQSVLREYPLGKDVDFNVDFNVEFLPVLLEAFLERPHQLKASSETLYTMMKDYFRMDPATKSLHTVTQQPQVKGSNVIRLRHGRIRIQILNR